MKTKNYVKISIAIILLMTILTMTISANPIMGSTSNYNINGTVYSAFNVLTISPSSSPFSNDGSVSGATTIYTNVQQPSGYMCVQPRVFENGMVKYWAGGWYTNDANRYDVSASAGGMTMKNWSYYSSGRVQIWNGSSYNEYTPSPTTSMAAFSAGIATNSGYEINEEGQTYGSALYASSDVDLPDLILAIGVNDTIGYVYTDDLLASKPTNPDEAVMCMEQLQEMNDNGIYSIFIPLYDVDGETIIGDFEISIDISSGTDVR